MVHQFPLPIWRWWYHEKHQINFSTLCWWWNFSRSKDMLLEKKQGNHWQPQEWAFTAGIWLFNLLPLIDHLISNSFGHKVICLFATIYLGFLFVASCLILNKNHSLVQIFMKSIIWAFHKNSVSSSSNQFVVKSYKN